MTFNPAQWFERGESRKGVPGWIMTEAELRNLPDEIGGWIEEVEAREIVKDGVTVRKMWVRFASKVGLTQIIAKHLLGENLNVNVGQMELERITEQVDSRGKAQRLITQAPLMIEAKADEPHPIERRTAVRRFRLLPPSPLVVTRFKQVSIADSSPVPGHPESID